MPAQLYLVPLPDAQTQSADEAVASRVDVQGLLEDSGVAAEAIATDSIDLTISGQWRYGSPFSEKVARELESLGESTYAAVPLFDTSKPAGGEQNGYYEVKNVDVSRAHPTTDEVYEYTAALTVNGTQRTSWRSVPTNPESVNTGLATGSGGQVGLPATATKVRWWDVASGTEAATVQSTVNAEFGDVDLYDPTEPTFDNPTLIYSQPYDGEGEVDVRLWDDRGVSKFKSFDGGSTEVVQWRHVYHTSAEYEGDPVVDTGLLRVGFDESAGTIDAEQWNDGTSSWDSVSLTYGDYELFDVDFTRIGPARVVVYTEWEDTTDGSIDAAVLSFQRGLDECVVRQPENGTVGSSLESVLDPIASDQTTDATPEQTVTARSDVR